MTFYLDKNLVHICNDKLRAHVSSWLVIKDVLKLYFILNSTQWKLQYTDYIRPK